MVTVTKQHEKQNSNITITPTLFSFPVVGPSSPLSQSSSCNYSRHYNYSYIQVQILYCAWCHVQRPTPNCQSLCCSLLESLCDMIPIPSNKTITATTPPGFDLSMCYDTTHSHSHSHVVSYLLFGLGPFPSLLILYGLSSSLLLRLLLGNQAGLFLLSHDT